MPQRIYFAKRGEVHDENSPLPEQQRESTPRAPRRRSKAYLSLSHPYGRRLLMRLRQSLGSRCRHSSQERHKKATEPQQEFSSSLDSWCRQSEIERTHTTKKCELTKRLLDNNFLAKLHSSISVRIRDGSHPWRWRVQLVIQRNADCRAGTKCRLGH